MRNIVLDIRLIRPAKVVMKGTWFEHTRKEKEIGHYTSSPFAGTYSCYLNYTTFATELLNANNGSTFRDYQSAWVGFQPKDEKGRTFLTDAKPGWFRRILGLDPRSTSVSNKDISDKVGEADFMFREIFETDGKHLDDNSWYFLAWNQLEAFRGDRSHHMDVHKRRKAKGKAKDDETLALSHLTATEKNRIRQNMVGTEVWGNWERTGDQDIGYNVAQAEAKMMTYAIYGQEKIRSVGDIWSIDSETLESFFPLQSGKRKPFSFNGGKIVLTVEAIDENGVMAVKSLKGGQVDGAYVSTDLNIQPRTESEFKPQFKVDKGDARNNFVRFMIDSRNEVCTKAEMQVYLRNYGGVLPKVEQLSLEEKNNDRELRASIQNGEIRLYCAIKTDVEDMD